MPKALAICRTALGQPPVETPVAADLADGVCLAWGGPSRAVSHLWQLLVCTGVIPRGGAPPPVLAGERAA
jgi:hypothetical protein